MASKSFRRSFMAACAIVIAALPLVISAQAHSEPVDSKTIAQKQKALTEEAEQVYSDYNRQISEALLQGQDTSKLTQEKDAYLEGVSVRREELHILGKAIENPGKDDIPGSNCDTDNHCPTVTVQCGNMPPNVGGLCNRWTCQMTLSTASCDRCGLSNGSGIDSTKQPVCKSNDPLTLNDIGNECVAEHELSHANDDVACPKCGTEGKAYAVSESCWEKAEDKYCTGDLGTTNTEACDLMEKNRQRQEEGETFSNCLCTFAPLNDSGTTTSTYPRSLCNQCALINHIDSKHANELIKLYCQPGLAPDKFPPMA